MRIFSENDGIELRNLLERAQRGDRRAWDQIVERFQMLVYSVARRTGLGADDAADVFQATFLALYNNLDRIERAEGLAKWLSVTAAREALKHRRTNARYTSEHDLTLSLDETLADEATAADQVAEIAEDADYWRTAIKMLGGRCEGLLTALYFEERTYEDIVATLGIPLGAIGPTRSRCLEKLRKMYQKSRGEAQE